MDVGNRRAPLRKGRRISLNVNLSPDAHRELGRIANGNRSAAIEHLVSEHLERKRAESQQPETA